MAERWTDDRFDDLKHQVESLGRHMEQEYSDLRVEIAGLRTDVNNQIGALRTEVSEQVGGLRGEMNEQVGGLRSEMNSRFDQLETRFDKLVYALVGLSVSIFAAMMGLIAAVILSL